MEFFAYVSLSDLGKVMIGQFPEMGVNFRKDADRVCSQNFNAKENYMELFEDLKSVESMQRFYAGKPEFEEGGVVVKIRIPRRLAEQRSGSSILKIQDEGRVDFIEVPTTLIKSKLFRADNFEDAVFDKNCETSVSDIQNEFDFRTKEHKGEEFGG